MSHAGDELTEEMDKAFAAFNLLAINYGLMEEEEEEQLIEIFKKKLIAEIEKTFADVEYPGDDHLAVSKIRGDSVDFAEAIRGKHWKELSKAVLLKHVDSLIWLTPEAVRFYLPAFMIAELGPDGLGYNSYTFTFLQPSDPSDNRLMELFLNYLSVYTADEKAVLRAFVKFGIEVGHFDVVVAEETIKFWNL